MNRIKKILFSLAITLGLSLPMAMPVAVSAQANIDDSLCKGASLSVEGECNPAAQEEAANSVDNLITTVINIFSIIVGVVSVIMIIIGGFKYITSGGDSANVTGAKNTILYAIIGLVVVALAQIIVQFVLSKVSETA